MDQQTYHFSLLSSTFSHGAYQTQNFNQPELRPLSVKGMIRWWHKALGYPEYDAQHIFGCIGKNPQAASVSIRIEEHSATIQNTDFMPHKGHQGGSKNALAPDNHYTLTISNRRAGLPPTLASQLTHSVKAWLFLGAIGQRSNRAAGSILWDQAPADQKNFETEASTLTANSKISFAVLDKDFDNDETYAREIAGDFLESRAFNGTAPFGAANPRKPSPLKLKCVRLDGKLKLLAIWDHRREAPANLENGIKKLIASNKEIGHLLKQALPKLTS